MTNRPRRSRPNRSRNKTIDGDSRKVDTPPDSANTASGAATGEVNPSAESDPAMDAAAETFAKSEGMGESVIAGGQVTEDQPVAKSSKAKRPGTKKPEDTLAPPAEQPVTAAPEKPADAGVVSGDDVGAGATEARSGRNSDWSKTGGYQGPAAVTRTPEPVKRNETPARPAVGRENETTMMGSSTKAPPPSGSSGLGFGGALFAGLIGALVALVVTAYLYSYGFLDQLRDGLAGPPVIAEDTTGEDIERLAEELVTLRRDIEASVAADQEPSAGIPGLTPEQLEELGNRIAALESTAVEAASAGEEDAAGATQDMSAFEQALTETQANMSGLQESATGAGEAAASAQEAAERAAAAVQDAIEAGETGRRELQAAIEQALAAGETGRQELRAAIEEATSTTAARLDAIEAGNSQARIALAAAGMKSAIDNGSPFTTELQTYAEAGGPQQTVEALQPYAENGVPTVGSLAQRWADVKGAVSAALTGPGADAPIGDQMLAGFRSLVETRSTGEVLESANTPDAIIGRLDNAISTGDFPGFVDEWQSLPEDAQAAGGDFIADVEARLAANQALSDAISATLSGGANSGADAQTNQG
ncbi:hypothetical protein FP2506_14074 [Fulvimarina pelagi HTCC2506]|uniref:Phage tail protein n=1 Tax=Fulvimarina pelagi HTCC2506 TaxID=314231 RepID=Q0G4B5_9HYPH|nr:hypothetical protein [Fulvimarina pelagi]EAU41566.1 hypothetical protein FP2506_14074 [Fulvimarina pelagi HTCC2506]